MSAQISLPIFPLPDLTFFPHTMLPLHIFEARYRAMITDCLSRDRRLAVVGLRPGYEASYEGRPAVYGVMGVGRIVQWERMATGRFNLLLQGECRARIDRELPGAGLHMRGDGHEVKGKVILRAGHGYERNTKASECQHDAHGESSG